RLFRDGLATTRQMNGQNLFHSRASISAGRKSSWSPHHDQPTSFEHIARQRLKVSVQLVLMRVDVLKDHGIKAGEVLAEQLIHRKGNERHLVWTSFDLILQRTKNEE